MTITWILYVLLVGALLTLAANAAESALRLAGRATRWVWALSLIGIAASGVVAPRATSLSIVMTDAVAAATPSPSVAADAPSNELGDLLRSARVAVASSAVRAITAVGSRVPTIAARPVMLGWIVASALLLAIYVIVNAQLDRARRRWPRERLQGIEVRIAPAAGPAVIGMLRAEIVVPRSLLDRDAEQQRMVIEHEQEHLRVGDHLLLAFACLAVIALPWHPAVWYALARLRLAIELDCDARVLRRGAAPRTYGALLIDMAARGAGIRVGTLALADRPSHLERRLLAMRATRSRFVLVRAGGLCAVAALLTLAACEARMPTSAELTTMDVEAVEKAAVAAKFSERLDNADYFLNGVKSTAEETRALDPKRIGSVEVVKGGRDTIFVTTADRMVIDSANPQRTMLRTPGGSGVEPTIIIDKVRSTSADLEKLRGEDVESIQMLKPGAVADMPNGAIIIERRAPGAPRLVTPRVIPDSKMLLRKVESGAGERTRAASSGPIPDVNGTGDRVMVRTPSGAQPAYMIDGVPATAQTFSALDQSQVVAVAVVKDKLEAMRLSKDPAAANGLVQITTKLGAKKQ